MAKRQAESQTVCGSPDHPDKKYRRIQKQSSNLVLNKGESMSSQNYLTPLFDEIENALNANLYLSALFMTLTIPDICSSLEVNNPDQNVGARYKQWCHDNLDLSKFSLISIDDIYYMRCKALHNGQAQDIQKSSISQYVLVCENNCITMVNCSIKLNNHSVYVYSAKEFCLEIIKSGRKWSEKNRNDPVISVRMEKLLRYHMNGLSPLISGVPVIA